ncbi:MAG: T9SS type A sorting domain-containing protein [Flavobacteriales bacterium]|nr:T9SS type A sorting domain-containing protein [Flavobacteriales bacterium]
MKKMFSILCAVCVALVAGATDVQLLVQKVDNQGLVPGNTYRVYAQMLDANKNVHAIFGDSVDPMSITSTTSFYQHQFGAYSAIAMNPVAISVAPELAYDSWITLGYETSENNDLWDIGLSFADFSAGNGISTDNGAWFLLPTDAKCEANDLGLVLLGQFTTTGTASGTLNIQGWDGPNNNWQARNLTFITTDAVWFGCNDAQASNYNAQAGFNDGTCQYANGNNTFAQQGHDVSSKGIEEVSTWEVFPNPIRNHVIHLQFSENIDLSQKTLVDIFDMNGRLVNGFVINEGMVTGGNRITLEQELSGGSYKIVLNQGSQLDSKTIIVEK